MRAGSKPLICMDLDRAKTCTQNGAVDGTRTRTNFFTTLLEAPERHLGKAERLPFRHNRTRNIGRHRQFARCGAKIKNYAQL